MKSIFPIIALCGLLLTSCIDTQENLKRRAAELCRYIPDHQLLEKSKDYMTEDFYAVLDTMFNLPEHEAMDHEWLYYFVTGNGGTIADYDVVSVEKTDPNHAVATVNVRQIWEDGSFDPTTDIEEHRLYMEKTNGKWLMSDFDEHKADCIRYIQNNRQEQAVRDSVSSYLIREIGCHYLQADLCIPVLMMVAAEEIDSLHARIFGDFWVFWYTLADDTLKTISGGNHSGCMTIAKTEDGSLSVTDFEQTVDGAGNDASARIVPV